MGIVLGGARSKSKSRSKRPSIREVCLVGIEGDGEGRCPALARSRDWADGGRVTWSGRAYRVEAAGGRTEGDEPRRYVHLSALAEG